MNLAIGVGYQGLGSATTPEGSPSGVYRATRDFTVTNGVQRSLLSWVVHSLFFPHRTDLDANSES